MAKSQPRGTALPWPAVVARRLARHGLAEPGPAEGLAEQVAVMCGAHAQIITAAEISVGMRVAGITRADVQSALWTDHRLIKTFGPRGTVHLLAAADLPIWTGALSALPPRRTVPQSEQYLTPAQIDQVIAAIAEALAEAELTVDELTQALVARLGAWVGDPVMPAFQTMWPRWRFVTDTAANSGALCFGPVRGRNVTYTNPRRFLPNFRPAPGPEALAFVVRRYLHAYGPATPQQFARWLNASPRWAADLFTTLGDQLEPVTVEGEAAWMVAGDTALPAERPAGLRLLPYFDAYGVGSYPREKVFPGRAAERALAGGQAGNFPLLLIDGTVAGIWHQRRAGKKIVVTVEAFGTLTARQRRALDEQVARLGEIQGGQPELTMGTVTVGPHA